MSRQYQISYIIEAIDRASSTFANVEKNLKRMDKALEKYSSMDKNRANKHSTLLSKNMKDRVNGEEKTSKQIQLIRNRELSNWAREENRRHRQEIRRQNQSLNLTKSIEREKTRIRVNAQRTYYDAQGLGVRSMSYVTAPVAVGAALSLKNTMDIEQLRLTLYSRFGEKSTEIFKEISDYAIQTAFSIKDVTTLMTGLKGGVRNLGISTPEEMMQISKDVGNVLLAFTTSSEDRYEVVRQLRQIAQKGYAEGRMDLDIMTSRNIPIVEALEDYTGKSITKLKEEAQALTGSNRLQAKLIYDALIYLSKTDAVLKTLELRGLTLTQAWDSAKDSLFLFSGEYGNVLSKRFDLPEKLREASTFFQSMTESLKKDGDISSEFLKQVASFGTGLALVAIPLGSFTLGLSRILSMIGGSGGLNAGALLFGRHLLSASGIFSGMYLLSYDWKKLLSDINNDGMSGLLKHMDLLIAGALTLLTTVKSVRTALGLGLIAKVVSSVTAPVLAVGAASAYGGYKLGQFGVNAYGNYVDKIKTEEILARRSEIDAAFPIADRGRYLASREASREARAREEASKIQVINNIKVDKTGYVSAETKVSNSALSNPVIIYDIGD